MPLSPSPGPVLAALFTSTSASTSRTPPSSCLALSFQVPRGRAGAAGDGRRRHRWRAPTRREDGRRAEHAQGERDGKAMRIFVCSWWVPSRVWCDRKQPASIEGRSVHRTMVLGPAPDRQVVRHARGGLELGSSTGSGLRRADRERHQQPGRREERGGRPERAVGADDEGVPGGLGRRQRRSTSPRGLLAVPNTVTSTASPSEPPTCCITLTSPDAAPASAGATPSSAAVVSGTNASPLPRPKTSSGPTSDDVAAVLAEAGSASSMPSVEKRDPDDHQPVGAEAVDEDAGGQLRRGEDHRPSAAGRRSRSPGRCSRARRAGTG